jgi:two-component system alkaline phosphatase synthesis response regulator PhoP/two-component system response regulator ResD
MPTILVVDDEPNILELTQLYLTNDGHKVLSARDGREALRLARTEKPDLMVLDLMLPEVDGFEVCRRLRQDGLGLPIIMLTARDDDVDKIVGLELGADDYVTKPFNPRELAARVRAVLRRAEPKATRSILRLGEMILDEGAREARVGERTLALRQKEFDLLATLMRNANTALERERLLEMVWGYEFYGDTRTVDVHIARLREKLKGSSLEIETVWGIGYKLVER